MISIRWRRMLGSFALALLSVCLGAAPAYGQRPAVGSTTELTGTVHDTLGRPVADVVVRLRRTRTTARTNQEGRFVISVARGVAQTLELTRFGFPPLAMDLAASSSPRDSIDIFLFGGEASATGSTTNEAESSARGGSQRPIGVVAAESLPTLGPLKDAQAARVARRPYTIRGTITDTTGRPLTGAVVAIASERRSTLTDSTGQYQLAGLSPGAAMVRVRRVGFSPRTFVTSVSREDAIIADVQLDAIGQALGRVTVRASGTLLGPTARGFLDRKRMGFGQFITRDEFVDRNPLRFTELMNRFSGVVYANDANGRRRVYGRGRCEMAIFLDGVNLIIPDNTSVDDFIDIYEVEAVEVHSGVGGLPAEFSGRTNACGVVAAWTRRKSGR
jgi:Carboxypeptidase regulatory-like domain